MIKYLLKSIWTLIGYVKSQYLINKVEYYGCKILSYVKMSWILKVLLRSQIEKLIKIVCDLKFVANLVLKTHRSTIMSKKSLPFFSDSLASSMVTSNAESLPILTKLSLTLKPTFSAMLPGFTWNKDAREDCMN